MAATGQEQPGTAAYGVALLSRYPVRSWQVLRLPRIPFTFPMWLPGPRKVIVVHEEPRAAVVGGVDDPARRADRGEHPPVVRARLGPACSCAGCAATWPRSPGRWC